MSKKGGKTPAQGSKPYANEHCVYSALSKPDRRALRDVLSMAFPIGKSSHRLWSVFPDTTAFVRRIREVEEGDPPEGILGGAITEVMWFPMLAFEVWLALWFIIKGAAMPRRSPVSGT